MLERYGFHALEGLQCQVERRAGGETGVRVVQCLARAAVWQAAAAGRWSHELADRALAAIAAGPGRLDPDQVEDPHLFLLEYNDGCCYPFNPVITTPRIISRWARKKTVRVGMTMRKDMAIISGIWVL